jgi:hypothetical protein
MSSKPNFVYVIYIAATPEKVWQALTDPGVTKNTGSAFGSRPTARPANT